MVLRVQAGGSSAALAALGDQLARAGYLPSNGSSNALHLQASPLSGPLPCAGGHA